MKKGHEKKINDSIEEIAKKEKENVKENYFLIFGITIENSKANKI